MKVNQKHHDDQPTSGIRENLIPHPSFARRDRLENSLAPMRTDLIYCWRQSSRYVLEPASRRGYLTREADTSSSSPVFPTVRALSAARSADLGDETRK